MAGESCSGTLSSLLAEHNMCRVKNKRWALKPSVAERKLGHCETEKGIHGSDGKSKTQMYLTDIRTVNIGGSLKQRSGDEGSQEGHGKDSGNSNGKNQPLFQFRPQHPKGLPAIKWQL
ncbi:unnamed protein product [Leptidea sinapis]|uniref:Uncharacterized protein n=1 Tax=Leptidea sinapis TaxID=189913 RepID=A0A5E4R541_9NEOP|nr:unnamed protein product [Leptidea sinapis]